MRTIIVKQRNKPVINISRKAVKGGALYRDNTVDAFTPKLWAMEGLAIFYENMVYGKLVHRDFSPMIQKYGDTVNTRRPAKFKGKRKTAADNVTIQDAVATNVPVKLDQHVHVSFLIKDGEETTSFQDLVDTFLRPAIAAEASFLDRVLASQVYQFMPNGSGHLNGLTVGNAKNFILGARQAMNDNYAPDLDRRLVLNSPTESKILEVENFTDASYIGDDGTALRRASLGWKYGFDILMDQNQPYVNNNTAGTTTGAVNNAGGYSAGTTSLTVDSFSAAITAGTWLTVAGDDTPQQVVSTTGGATPTAIVITPGLKYAVADDAAVVLYPKGTSGGNYAYNSNTGVGYNKELTVAGFSSIAPQVGQLVTFGTSTTGPYYAIVDVNGSTGITLDRPLEASVSSGDAVNLGPTGSFNLAFNRNAISLVSRPLALPRQGTGALAGVAEYENIAMRVTITYNGEKQGHLVTVDMLMGVKVLDQDLGAVIYA